MCQGLKWNPGFNRVKNSCCGVAGIVLSEKMYKDAAPTNTPRTNVVITKRETERWRQPIFNNVNGDREIPPFRIVFLDRRLFPGTRFSISASSTFLNAASLQKGRNPWRLGGLWKCFRTFRVNFNLMALSGRIDAYSLISRREFSGGRP